MSHRLAGSVAYCWNMSVATLKSLCRGNDWMLFSKVFMILFVIGSLGCISLQTLFMAGLPILFIAFYVYEKKEDAIDNLVSRAATYGCKLKSYSTKRFGGSRLFFCLFILFFFYHNSSKLVRALAPSKIDGICNQMKCLLRMWTVLVMKFVCFSCKCKAIHTTICTNAS